MVLSTVQPSQYGSAVAPRRFKLPPRGSLKPSAGVDQDPLPYYYLPVIGAFYKKRLTVALELMGDRHFNSLLEVGYGSGVLLPVLSSRCDRLAGIDLHANVEPVREFLSGRGVAAELHVGDVTDLPFGDGAFDCVVCLSVLEHVDDPDRGILEIRRVLAGGGVAVVGIPTRNLVSSSLIRLLGFNPSKQHPNDHHLLLSRLSSLFPAQRMELIPSFLPPQLGLYVVLRCVKAPDDEGEEG